MLPRPHIRLPLWSVPLIVAALYVARSFVRGSWSPELPMDAVLLVMVAFVMFAVARLRSTDEVEADVPPESDSRGLRGDGPDQPS